MLPNTGGAFFRGTALSQDHRFTNKHDKFMAGIVFPVEYDEKLNIEKVRVDVFEAWVDKRVTQILGTHDELLEQESKYAGLFAEEV